MSSVTSKIPVTLRITHSSLVSKTVLLPIYCSRNSSILFANTRNKKENQETVKCSINFRVGQLLIIAVHGPVAFGEPLVSFPGVCVILLISVLNSPAPRKKEGEMEGMARDGT